MELIHQLVDLGLGLVNVVLHLDQHLNQWIQLFGPGIYLVLFFIIFAETGLVVFPFLPGDSLLFALGALTAGDNPALDLPLLCGVLLLAAILGDAVNYMVGRRVGLKLFSNPQSKVFKREHLARTQKFYEKHGGKTIILARFVPIIRTFAPFVAGMAEMTYPRFFLYNVVGGAGWVVSVAVAGHVFGNLPVIKKNFHFVVLAIILISVVPIALEYWKARRETRAGAANGA
jgi:membrane-associated protein